MTAQEEVKPTLESAETCKECHEQHYLEWTNSGHAHFSREQNLPFLTLSQRAGAGNKDISRCQACHEPLRQFSDAVSDPDIIAKAREIGITGVIVIDRDPPGSFDAPEATDGQLDALFDWLVGQGETLQREDAEE